jgi:hypothetical protein
MKPKFLVQVALFTAVSSLGWWLPLAQAQADEAESQANSPAGQVIPFACYNRAGTVVFTTINPQNTVGWDLGCREVQYESVDPASPPLTYFQCFDQNGGTAFKTIDAEVARDSDLFCREIGTRLSNPIPLRPVHYECFTATGDLAFTTSYPQDTFGWKPGCRELQYQDEVLAQQPSSPRSSYECLDISGNVAFTTNDQQEARRWRIGCREIKL